jgi:MFS superfamily sulfate permease-like transporter
MASGSGRRPQNGSVRATRTARAARVGATTSSPGTISAPTAPTAAWVAAVSSVHVASDGIGEGTAAVGAEVGVVLTVCSVLLS